MNPVRGEIGFRNELISGEPILAELKNSLPKSLFDEVLYEIGSGDSLLQNGYLEHAVIRYENAVELTNSYSLVWLKVLLYNRLGFASYWLVNIEKATTYYKESFRICSESNTIPDTLVVLESLVYLQECNQSINADNHSKHRNLIDVIEKWGGPKHPKRQLNFCILKSILYSNSFEYGKGIQQLNKAEELVSESTYSNFFWLFVVKYLKAHNYYAVRNNDLALAYLLELETQLGRLNATPPYYHFLTYLLCNIYLVNNELDLARKYAESMKNFIGGSSNIFFYSDYMTIGHVNQELDHASLALGNYMQALDILRENNIKDYRLAHLFYWLSRYYRLNLGDEVRSFQYIQEAEKVVQNTEPSYINSYIRFELGTHFFRKGEYEKAIEIFNTELDKLDELLYSDDYFRENFLVVTQTSFLTILMRRGAAKYYFARNRDFDPAILESSYNDFKAVLVLNKKLFSMNWFEASQLTSLAEMRFTFDNLINVGYELYLKTGNDTLVSELYKVAENSKSVILKNFLLGENAKQIAGVTEDEIIYARQLKKEIDTLQYGLLHLNSEVDQGGRTSLIEQIRLKTIQYGNFDAGLRNKYPEYNSLMEQEKEIDFREIQDHMESSQVILEYHIVGKDFYIFYLDKDTLILNYSVLDNLIADEINIFREKLINLNYGEFSADFAADFIKRSHALYQILIEPFESRIRGKRLLLVPDKELGTIPFELLVPEPYDSTKPPPTFDKIKYLIHDNPVAYLYSSMQMLNPVRLSKRKINYAGFAPDYSQLAESILAIDSNRFSIGPLPGAYQEVIAGKKYFGGKTYIAEAIGKAQYFKASSHAKILHLAMHTLLDENEPMNSILLFSSEIYNTQHQLHAYEVYSKRSKSSLVVLSACNTGTGKIESGEGVFSIARAFLLAGFSNVVLTQWSVADRSGTEIIDRYYYYLSAGHPADIALQQSKLDFLKNGDPVKAHPYFWGPYIQTGNPIVIVQDKFEWKVYGGLIIALLLGLAYFIRRRYL